MLKPSPLSILAPLTLSGAFALSACASQPAIPVVATCPQFPQPPPSLMQTPQAENALNELEVELQTLAGDAKPTPPASTSSSSGSGSKPR